MLIFCLSGRVLLRICFHFQCLINHELIVPVIYLLDKGEFKVQKEAVWVITNFTSGGTPNQVLYLIECEVLGPLCRMLATHDTQITMVALDAINNIFLVRLLPPKNMKLEM